MPFLAEVTCPGKQLLVLFLQILLRSVNAVVFRIRLEGYIKSKQI